MEYLSTSHIGCNGTDIVVPGDSHTIRFDSKCMYAYATLLSLIHEVFHLADVTARENNRDTPYKVAVLIQRVEKRKSSDPETTLDRIKWIFENSAPPKGGMIVSFYHSPNIQRSITTQYMFNYLWPFKERWIGDENYVTFQKLEDNLYDQKKNYSMPHQEMVLDKLETYGYNVRFVDYCTPIEELCKLLKHAKAHFTYTGATYYFAGTMGMPVIAFGEGAETTKAIKTYTLNHEEKYVVPNYYGKINSPLDHLMNYKYDSEGNPYSISTYPQNITNLGKVEDLDDNFSELFWKMISDEIS